MKRILLRGTAGRGLAEKVRYFLCFPSPGSGRGHDHRANVRTMVRVALEQHLRHEPTKRSKSRSKRLRGFSRPQYRHRVGDDIRVFYDVIENAVEILAIVLKSEAIAWLEKHGESDETNSSVGNQG